MEIIPYNGTTLAFIGDAVMTLWIREYLVKQGYQKPNDLQKMTSHYVSAKAQANYLNHLLEQNFFDEDEMEIIKRGRNAQTKTVAKNADVMTYRLATGFEAIIGYFYLYQKVERLGKLWDAILLLGEQ
ncbi:MAG: Mini-ribonuclease 3 [Traorella sp.]